MRQALSAENDIFANSTASRPELELPRVREERGGLANEVLGVRAPQQQLRVGAGAGRRRLGGLPRLLVRVDLIIPCPPDLLLCSRRAGVGGARGARFEEAVADLVGGCLVRDALPRADGLQRRQRDAEREVAHLVLLSLRCRSLATCL